MGLPNSTVMLQVPKVHVQFPSMSWIAVLLLCRFLAQHDLQFVLIAMICNHMFCQVPSRKTFSGYLRWRHVKM